MPLTRALKRIFLLLCCLGGGAALGSVAAMVAGTVVFGTWYDAPADLQSAFALGGAVGGLFTGGLVFLRSRRRGVWKDRD